MNRDYRHRNNNFRAWFRLLGFLRAILPLVLAVSIFSIVVKPALALDPLVVWTESGTYDDVIRFNTYSSGWGTEGTASDTNAYGRLQWHVAETSPDGAEQVALAVLNSADTLYATIYDGTNWSASKNLGTIYDYHYRGFSAAYEQSSGDLLIVQGTSLNNQIKYWVWDGSTWVVNGSTYTFGTATINDNVVWVELASDPGTNQIALMVVDLDRDVAALIWDGDTNTWDSDSEKKLNSALIPSYTEKQIDVEYMQSGTNQGQALFAWAQASTIYSWTWTGSAWAPSAKSHAAGVHTIYWVTLAADPNSDDILLGYYDSYNDIHTIDWDGSDWGTDRGIEAYGFNSYRDSYPFDIIFESASGHESHALVVYSDGDQLRYKHTSDISGDWGTEQTPAAFLSTDDCHWIQLVRDLNGTIYMAGQDDGADNLIGKTWDNTSWTSEGVLDTPIDTDDIYKNFAITATAGPPFSGDAELGEHASGQIEDAFGACTSVYDAELFRFQLENTTGSELTVDEIVFQLSSVTGIVDSDFSDLRINDGASDVATGPTVDVSGGTITFSDTTNGLFTIAASTTKDYTLIGDVSSLEDGDTVTLALGTSNVTLDSGTVGGPGPTNVTHTAGVRAGASEIDDISDYSSDPLAPTSSRNIVRDASGYWYPKSEIDFYKPRCFTI